MSAAVGSSTGSAFGARKRTAMWIEKKIAKTMATGAQKSGVIWLGWNTEALKSSQLRGGLTWTLERASGPGRVAVFTTGSFGDATVIFDSSRSRPGSRTIALGVHAHANWSFSRAGTYKLRFRSSATTRGGKALSDTATLTVRVR